MESFFYRERLRVKIGGISAMVKIIAHRGFGKGPVENTLYAVKESLGLGVDGIEIDVHTSSDGEVVVFHDFLVDERTNGTGPVAELTLEELKTLELSRGLKIPTLRELIEQVKDKPDLLVMIEIKPENIEESVLNVIHEEGIESQVVISSYQLSVLRGIQELSPSIRTVLIFKTPLTNSIQQASGLGCSGIAPRFHLVSHELVEMSRQAGLMIFPWAVNVEEELQRMMDLGVKAVITDEVQRIQQVLNARSNR
jgi:glycerophosphoryl diester phosphodiesterase